MENAISYLNVLPSTQDQLKNFEAHFVSEMEQYDPLQISVQLKAIEELVSNLRANNRVREYIMMGVDSYPEKTFEKYGAKFEKAETNVKYDYSKCDDSVLQELEAVKLGADNKLKERQTFLKLLKEPVANVDTGEIINPALRTSNTYVKISLK